MRAYNTNWSLFFFLFKTLGKCCQYNTQQVFSHLCIVCHSKDVLLLRKTGFILINIVFRIRSIYRQALTNLLSPTILHNKNIFIFFIFFPFFNNKLKHRDIPMSFSNQTEMSVFFQSTEHTESRAPTTFSYSPEHLLEWAYRTISCIQHLPTEAQILSK